MKKIILSALLIFLFVGCCIKPAPEATKEEPLVMEQVPVAIEKAPVVEEKAPVVVLPKSIFSSKTIRENSLSSTDICNLQFYTSHDIKLERKIPVSSSVITNGELVINKNDKILSIIIKKGTPGIAIKAEGNYIVIKFNDDIQLTFMHSNKKKDLYLLSAKKWRRGIGTLVVNSKEYLAYGSSGQAHLMVNRTDVDNSDSNTMVVEGSLLH